MYIFLSRLPYHLFWTPIPFCLTLKEPLKLDVKGNQLLWGKNPKVSDTGMMKVLADLGIHEVIRRAQESLIHNKSKFKPIWASDKKLIALFRFDLEYCSFRKFWHHYIISRSMTQCIKVEGLIFFSIDRFLINFLMF